jgi:hypothetical protein
MHLRAAAGRRAAGAAYSVRAAPLAPLVESSSTKEFEDPGSLVAYHGMGCADESKEPVSLLVKQSQEIPSTPDHAAVVLNGWHFLYLIGDHEVLGLTTGIFDVQWASPTLARPRRAGNQPDPKP